MTGPESHHPRPPRLGDVPPEHRPYVVDQAHRTRQPVDVWLDHLTQPEPVDTLRQIDPDIEAIVTRWYSTRPETNPWPNRQHFTPDETRDLLNGWDAQVGDPARRVEWETELGELDDTGGRPFTSLLDLKRRKADE